MMNVSDVSARLTVQSLVVWEARAKQAAVVRTSMKTVRNHGLTKFGSVRKQASIHRSISQHLCKGLGKWRIAPTEGFARPRVTRSPTHKCIGYVMEVLLSDCNDVITVQGTTRIGTPFSQGLGWDDLRKAEEKGHPVRSRWWCLAIPRASVAGVVQGQISHQELARACETLDPPTADWRMLL